jgi:hypothetical protein
MSLYGGIKFSIGDDNGSSENTSGNSEAKPLQVLGGGTSKDSIEKSYNDHPDEPPQAGGAKSSTKGPAQPPRPGKTSAALKFAPRIRQPKPVAGPSTMYAAEPVFIDTLQPTASSSTSQAKDQEIVFGNDGKALAKAPAMTLNARKRERGKEDSERRKQKKKQRARLFPSSFGN